MAKQQRVRPKRSVKAKTVVRRKKPAAKAKSPKRASPARRAAAQPPPAPATQEAPPTSRKPGFYEAVAIYERGVQALQRHDFQGAAGFFRAVLDRYPEERELLERARLYLRVCERETARQPQGPKTPAERVYAATVALNAGDHAGAMDHLQRALAEDPDSDHAHYTMAVALGIKGRLKEAIGHLTSAIGLNPENRALARQDPDLEALRGHDGFLEAIETPPIRRRFKPRR